MCTSFLYLENHFDGKNNAESQVAYFDDFGEYFWLWVEFDSHAEGVCQDTKKNGSLEDVVVDKSLQRRPKLEAGASETAENIA